MPDGLTQPRHACAEGRQLHAATVGSATSRAIPRGLRRQRPNTLGASHMQLNRAVPEQISGSLDVHTGLKPRHGRGMAQRVHAHALDACYLGEPR